MLVAERKIGSGGNFHVEPVAFAADQIALAIVETGAIAQRCVALMVDPMLSHDLPPFLTPGQADAGYEDARACAQEHGLRLPGILEN